MTGDISMVSSGWTQNAIMLVCSESAGCALFLSCVISPFFAYAFDPQERAACPPSVPVASCSSSPVLLQAFDPQERSACPPSVPVASCSSSPVLLQAFDPQERAACPPSVSVASCSSSPRASPGTRSLCAWGQALSFFCPAQSRRSG
eukprot:RCo029885